MVKDDTAHQVRVRVLLWGRTDQDLGSALSHATRTPARRTWKIVTEERTISATCPFDLHTPAALAADKGERWAYLVLHTDSTQTP